MSLPLILACVWVLLATATTALPAPLATIGAGVALIAAAPILIWIFTAHATWIGLLCCLAVASLYRRPIAAALAKAKRT
ncbi:DUF2484 family protein [Pseudoprimorskyibacter insulae]|uniref:UDP-N-acetylmuramate--alanine ligase n=1 Tax=Pseudoprimorskyibacter insulae TaxID=1695997 RepID=A0A2R8AWW8_9RHOB|nr:DUF2484 family protein [Pseudoprimorskyibacter insulae]SPF80354.1 hypothetical protein PRI8871_02159 [Pseudoprimorskyibacter insulae]